MRPDMPTGLSATGRRRGTRRYRSQLGQTSAIAPGLPVHLAHIGTRERTLLHAWAAHNDEQVQLGLGNHQFAQLIHQIIKAMRLEKQVQKARKGRQLTLSLMQKVCRGLNVAVWFRLSEEERELVFQPFVRLAPNIPGGFGLGLTFSRQLARQHGRCVHR